MKCPVCSSRNIDVSACEGFVRRGQTVKECADCGSVWAALGNKVNQVLVRGVLQKAA